MTEMSVTEFSRNLKSVINRIENSGEEIILVRNKRRIARIIPGSPKLTALEVMGDLYSTLSDNAGKDWLEQISIKEMLKNGIADPWNS